MIKNIVVVVVVVVIAATGLPTLCNPFGVLAAVTSFLPNLLIKKYTYNSLKKNIKCFVVVF